MECKMRGTDYNYGFTFTVYNTSKGSHPVTHISHMSPGYLSAVPKSEATNNEAIPKSVSGSQGLSTPPMMTQSVVPGCSLKRLHAMTPTGCRVSGDSTHPI
jgi:hypothetical protein